MLTIVAFDVGSNRTRRQITRLLKGQLYRHHESVFMGQLNPAKLYKLRKKLERCIKPDRDKVRIITLCPSDQRLVKALGSGIETPAEHELGVLI